MSTFADDPDAQRRYEALFGRRDYAAERPAPRETPDVTHNYVEYAEERRPRPVPAPTFDYPEPSATYARLAERARAGRAAAAATFGEPVGGVGDQLGEPWGGLGL